MEHNNNQEITYIRHFEQSGHGEFDPPLKRQPYPRRHRTQQYDVIVCSPYQRCRQTALACAAGWGTPVIVDYRLCEYRGGKKHDRRMIIATKFPDCSESWAACEARLDDFHAHLPEGARQPRVLVVTHGVCVRYMQVKLEGSSPYSRGRQVPYGEGFTVEL